MRLVPAIGGWGVAGRRLWTIPPGSMGRDAGIPRSLPGSARLGRLVRGELPEAPRWGRGPARGEGGARPRRGAATAQGPPGTNPQTARCYLYAVVDAGIEAPVDVPGIGTSGRVGTVHHRDLAAVVGPAPDRPLDARTDVLAHHRVLEAVGAAEGAVLPMRFGVVLPDHAAVVSRFLAPEHDRLRHALEQLRGREQFTLEVRYDRDLVLSEIVAADREIAHLDTQMRDRPEHATRAERLRLDELVADALEHRRAADASGLVGALGEHVVAVAADRPSDPDVVMRAAFLIDRGRRVAFEGAVEAIGRRSRGRLRMRLVGPQPSYDFLCEG